MSGRAKEGKRRVGLKYCGGCNPKYDRLALTEALKASLGEGFEWVISESDDVDFVLAIEGCQTACADLSPFEGKPIRVITSAGEEDAFVREVKLAQQARTRDGEFPRKGGETPPSVPF